MKVICPHCNTEFDWRKPKKAYSGGDKDPMTKLKLILSYLKNQDNWVWIRKIAKETKIKPYSVSYLIDKYLAIYLEILEPVDVYESTGLKIKMIKLKNKEIDINKILEDIKVLTNS